MMEIRVEMKGDAQRFVLEGDLTIEHAGEVRAAFVGIPADTHEIRVSLDKVTGVDVSVLQLFCSIHRTCEAGNRLFSFEGKPSEKFLAVARRAGYVPPACCFAKETTICLWKGEVSDEQTHNDGRRFGGASGKW